jgi:hypothetical protein
MTDEPGESLDTAVIALAKRIAEPADEWADGTAHSFSWSQDENGVVTIYDAEGRSLRRRRQIEDPDAWIGILGDPQIDPQDDTQNWARRRVRRDRCLRLTTSKWGRLARRSMMPIANLKFQLPEEQSEFDICAKAHALVAAVDEYFLELRNKIRNGELDDAEHAAYDAARSLLLQCLSNHDVETLF